MIRFIVVAVAVVFAFSPAEARHRHHHRYYHHYRHQDAMTQVVSNPDGCPHRLFCGCGAAVRVFGAPLRALWSAASWYKFPRSEPAPGTVAVRPHHVFVLEQHLSRDVWLVYDANSGRHMTRIHARSIAGYRIVNPHA